MSNMDFDRGYLVACANVVNMAGEITVAVGLLNESGIARCDIARFDLSEYDMNAIKKILNDPNCQIPK